METRIKNYGVHNDLTIGTSFTTSTILMALFHVLSSIRHSKGFDNYFFVNPIFHESFPLGWLYTHKASLVSEHMLKLRALFLQ